MLLEWLGDVGGLFGALYQIGAVLLFPLRSFAVKTELLTSIFRFVEARPAEKNDMQSKDFIDKQMLWDFQNIHKIARQGFFQTIFGLGKNAKYKRQLSKAESAIKTELDLQKFIKRYRIMLYSILSLLTSRQQFVVDKMINMLIHDASELEDPE